VEVIILSFLLNGDKMRERLAKILAQAEDNENRGNEDQNGRERIAVSHTSAFE
jgi:hypothetical protein